MAEAGICLLNLQKVLEFGGSQSPSSLRSSSHPAPEEALGSAVLGRALASGSQGRLGAWGDVHLLQGAGCRGTAGAQHL